MNKYQKEIVKNYKEFVKYCEWKGCIQGSGYRKFKKIYKHNKFSIDKMKQIRGLSRFLRKGMIK